MDLVTCKANPTYVIISLHIIQCHTVSYHIIIIIIISHHIRIICQSIFLRELNLVGRNADEFPAGVKQEQLVSKMFVFSLIPQDV